PRHLPEPRREGDPRPPVGDRPHGPGRVLDGHPGEPDLGDGLPQRGSPHSRDRSLAAARSSSAALARWPEAAWAARRRGALGTESDMRSKRRLIRSRASTAASTSAGSGPASWVTLIL